MQARVDEAYRLDLPTIAVVIRGNHEAAITIQAGEILEVVGPVPDNRFVVVDLRGEQVHVQVRSEGSRPTRA